MASVNCWRCLARPSMQRLAIRSAPIQVPRISQPTTAAPAPAASFTTSSSLQRPPPSAKNTSNERAKHIRVGKQLTLNKKKKTLKVKAKKVKAGERKAFRKRIQLSNDNALEVPGLPELNAETIKDPSTVGKMVALPNDLVDKLRTIEAFKATQQWNLFRAPHMLVRQQTVDLGKQLAENAEKKGTMRFVIDGGKGTGKSMLSLQALASGIMNDYVVIHLPEAQDLILNHTEYSPIANTNQFSQPVYLIKLMQSINKNSERLLFPHKVQGDYLNLPINVPRGMALSQLLVTTKEPEFAWHAWSTFWTEMMRPGRPPIFFSMDGLHHGMKISKYRSPSNELIHAHDLGIIRMFVEGLGGKSSFTNGAVFMGTTSRNNLPKNISVETALNEARAAQKSEPVPPRNPFERNYDERVFEALKGVKVVDVGGVDKPATRSLLEYWAASGMLRARVDEYLVSDKWTISGNGVLAEMERASLFDTRIAR